MNRDEKEPDLEELEVVEEQQFSNKDFQINKVNILCVDDKPENLKELGSLLQDNILEVVTAGSGKEALKKMEELEFALILLNAEMQNSEGYKTAEIMRSDEKSRHTPIIFITEESNDRHLLFKGYKAGAIDYLLRPIDPNILKSKISIFIELFVQKKLLEQKMKELEAIKIELEEANRELVNLSFIDGLTKIANRRRFDESLYWEWKRAERAGEVISIIMIDIDFFKLYNDNYGHQAGDQCLIKVAKALVECAQRPQDLVARYGGEEFVVVLPETNYKSGCYVAELMRRKVINLNMEHKYSIVSNVVTISLGVSTSIAGKDYELSEVMRLADLELYNAKKSGRNRISCVDLTKK